MGRPRHAPRDAGAVRPLRPPPLVTVVVGLAAAGVVAIGILPALFLHFPQVSTLLGR